MITYGQDFFWTKPDGSTLSMSSAGHATLEAAKAHMLQQALEHGWTPPRWWQISRWGDTKAKDLGFIAASPNVHR